LKTQLTARIAAEEAETKRRIDAVEEKAVLAVQLEAARSAQSASGGVGDNSDLDTYRVWQSCEGILIYVSELLGAVSAMIDGRIPPSLCVAMYFARLVWMYHLNLFAALTF